MVPRSAIRNANSASDGMVWMTPTVPRTTWVIARTLLERIPMGILSNKVRAMTQVVLGTVGVIQTIPSLALFAFLIALLGTIGTVPALIALFLYALLPILL